MEQIHIPILKSFDDLKFNLGKKTLIDFLKGDVNPTIERNHLNELTSYGCLYMFEKKDLINVIDILIKHNYLEKMIISGGFEVVRRTSLGIEEIYKKAFKIENHFHLNFSKELFADTVITDDDIETFSHFDFFLKKFNQEQKKAIISSNDHILCIAGAGTGKTTVLTKRIEFLKKFRNADESKILAVTFTRKACIEMKERLKRLGITNVRVETFNSFCEKIIKRHGELLYDGNHKVATFSDKIKIVKHIVKKQNIHFELIKEDYFTKKQLRNKTSDELFFLFVRDIFSILDFYKNFDIKISEFYLNEQNPSNRKIAKIMYDIVNSADQILKKLNLRDFSDQIIETLRLFKQHPKTIPKYDYILVDEYQDVNKVQVDLLKHINPKSLFVVGDPRQSIYGWRGSDINYILNFPKEFENVEVISLKTNYRSDKNIVTFFNKIIKPLGLVDLESSRSLEENSNVFLVKHITELSEKEFITQSIKSSITKKKDIFVLARTNKILENIAEFFDSASIKYIIKNDDNNDFDKEPKDDEVVLATVHSIKGMEAEEVYLAGANSLNFPNKVADNFIFSLIKSSDDYDKQAEELRLFYVALSRAKNKLVMTYTGNFSNFITNDSLNIIKHIENHRSHFDSSKNSMLDVSNPKILKNMLKDWRNSKSRELDIPLYMVIPNKTIDELVIKRPLDISQLSSINGLGTTKIMKYGNDILKILWGG